MKSVLYKRYAWMTGWLCIACFPLTSLAVDESIVTTREALSGYDIYFTESPRFFDGISVYRQIVPRTTGKMLSGRVDHGTFNYSGLTLYSQDPRYSTINGQPFLEFVSSTHDTSDEGPMFSMNSEMVLCWFTDESTLIEVEESRVRVLIEDNDMVYENRCIDNQSIEKYWRDVSRDIEIR